MLYRLATKVLIFRDKGDIVDIEMTELLQKIVDEAPQGIYVLDAERKIVFWSAGAERITGYSRWAAIALKVCWITLTGRGFICVTTFVL